MTVIPLIIVYIIGASILANTGFSQEIFGAWIFGYWVVVGVLFASYWANWVHDHDPTCVAVRTVAEAKKRGLSASDAEKVARYKATKMQPDLASEHYNSAAHSLSKGIDHAIINNYGPEVNVPKPRVKIRTK